MAATIFISPVFAMPFLRYSLEILIVGSPNLGSWRKAKYENQRKHAMNKNVPIVLKYHLPSVTRGRSFLIVAPDKNNHAQDLNDQLRYGEVRRLQDQKRQA